VTLDSWKIISKNSVYSVTYNIIQNYLAVCNILYNNIQSDFFNVNGGFQTTWGVPSIGKICLGVVTELQTFVI